MSRFSVVQRSAERLARELHGCIADRESASDRVDWAWCAAPELRFLRAASARIQRARALPQRRIASTILRLPRVCLYFVFVHLNALRVLLRNFLIVLNLLRLKRADDAPDLGFFSRGRSNGKYAESHFARRTHGAIILKPRSCARRSPAAYAAHCLIDVASQSDCCAALEGFLLLSRRGSWAPAQASRAPAAKASARATDREI